MATRRRSAPKKGPASPRSTRMDPFTLAYIEAALWSTSDESDDRGGEPLDKNYSVSDIDDATIAKMAADCAAFQEQFGELIDDDDSPDIQKHGARELAGSDFWMTRNGHGVGFWEDSDWPKHGEALDAGAKEYGEFDLYVGDDGMIYGSSLEPTLEINQGLQGREHRMRASSSLRVAIGTRGEIIESRRWKNARTGATASIYGAVPWTRQGDRDDWEVETVGYTIQWEDGTIGIGRAPFPTREEAEAWLERDRTRRAGYGATPWRGGATAPAKRRSGRVRDGDDEDEVEMWIDAQDNEAPWLAQHWHSSQGDPLYALGSTGFPQPESTISWALSNAKKSEAFQWAEMEKKYGKKRLQKLMAIDPESREARALPDEKREDLEDTDEISRLVYALQEALNHGERISAEEGLERQGVAPGTRW